MTASFCWKCGFGLTPRTSGTAAAPSTNEKLAASVASQTEGLSFGLSGLMLLIALIAVVVTLIQAAPGLGIALGVLLAPPLVRTWLVLGKKRDLRQQVGFAEKLLLFLGSFATTAVILCVVSIATVGTFCATCLGLYALGAGRSQGTSTAALIMVGIATLSVFLLLIWLFSFWIRARWRRDMGSG
jgi:hypothetical protein